MTAEQLSLLEALEIQLRTIKINGPDREVRIALADALASALRTALDSTVRGTTRTEPDVYRDAATVRVVVTDYHSPRYGGDDYCPYETLLHNLISDERVDRQDMLTRLVKLADAHDGDEVEVVIRKTGRRPFGNRRVRLVAPNTYKRETEEPQEIAGSMEPT